MVTRDGRTVKIHCTNYDSRQPIIAELEYHNFSSSFTKDGRYFNDDRNSPYDLFFASEKYEGWINLYKCNNSTQCYTSNPYDSEEKAIELGKMSDNYLKTVKIEWEA